MVSNVLGVLPEELIRHLGELHDSHASDAEYQALRGELPADWPI